MPFPSPWRRLIEQWPDVTLHFADLGARWAEVRWYPDGQTEVHLNRGLTQVQRRCALAHELEHLDRGAPCETLRASIEARVIASTARWLLPDLDALRSALAGRDLREAADSLWVTRRVLIDRLRHLTLTELDHVTAGRNGECAA